MTNEPLTPDQRLDEAVDLLAMYPSNDQARQQIMIAAAQAHVALANAIRDRRLDQAEAKLDLIASACQAALDSQEHDFDDDATVESLVGQITEIVNGDGRAHI